MKSKRSSHLRQPGEPYTIRVVREWFSNGIPRESWEGRTRTRARRIWARDSHGCYARCGRQVHNEWYVNIQSPEFEKRRVGRLQYVGQRVYHSECAYKIPEFKPLVRLLGLP